MKNNILAYHPILDGITLYDLLNDLKIMLEDTLFFEETIQYILEQNTQMSDEDISSLFNYSITNRLQWIIYVLNGLL